MKLLLSLGQQQRPPASLLQHGTEELDSHGTHPHAQSLAGDASLGPLPNRYPGHPRSNRIESTVTARGAKRRSHPAPTASGNAVISINADEPVARKQQSSACRFCHEQGHFMPSCPTLKGFGSPITLERWTAIKERAPIALGAYRSVLKSLKSLDDALPQYATHLIIEIVLKTSEFSHAVMLSAVNALGKVADDFKGRWRSASLVDQFLARHSRSSQGAAQALVW